MKTIDVKEKAGAVALTRKEKLLRWADLIQAETRPICVFHLLENWNWVQMGLPMASHSYPGGYATAFGIAAADPVFRAAGLAGDSVANSMKFFELSQLDIHEFSCNCGGQITGTQMADRVRHLAEATGAFGLGRTPSSFTAALMSLFQ
jgi:hypothetical protein